MVVLVVQDDDTTWHQTRLRSEPSGASCGPLRFECGTGLSHSTTESNGSCIGYQCIPVPPVTSFGLVDCCYCDGDRACSRDKLFSSLPSVVRHFFLAVCWKCEDYFDRAGVTAQRRLERRRSYEHTTDIRGGSWHRDIDGGWKPSVKNKAEGAERGRGKAPLRRRVITSLEHMGRGWGKGGDFEVDRVTETRSNQYHPREELCGRVHGNL